MPRPEAIFQHLSAPLLTDAAVRESPCAARVHADTFQHYQQFQHSSGSGPNSAASHAG